MAKLLVLGGGSCQVNAILRAKQKGHTVVVADYYADAPGKSLSHYSELVSTFDAEGNIAVARKHGIDGVLTVGTDQPVLTCARVAQELGLPSFLDPETARAVTNKKVMKEKFKEQGIPTPRYKILKEGFSADELQGIRFPVVIKPLDSQGQRGVYKLHSGEEIRRLFKDVVSYSRENEILLEEYYASDEITLSGWVHDGVPHILTITDRITINSDPHLGICLAHDFPSKYLPSCFRECKELTAKIVQGFGICNGPIYFQMLIGAEGIRVNEVACRIGGAYEDELIPALTGIDILEMVIAGAVGDKIDCSTLEEYDLLHNQHYASVEMLFTKPGLIGSMPDMAKIIKLPGVLSGSFNCGPGNRRPEIENATQRAGYLIVRGESRDEWRQNLRNAYQQLGIYDAEGSRMLVDLRSK